MTTTSKKCTICNAIKDVSEFGKNKLGKNGLRSDCKRCNNLKSKRYSRTKRGVISTIYASQKQSSKQRKHDCPKYSKKELLDWLMNDWTFNLIFENWVNCGYSHLLKPSIDRKDDYLPYSFDNIQLMTWGENKKKGYIDSISGRNNKKNKAVNQLDKSGQIMSKYYSIRGAGRATKTNKSNIISCCKGNVKTAGGFRWEYA